MNQAPAKSRSLGQQTHPPRADRVYQLSGFLTLIAMLLVAVGALAGCAGSSVSGPRATSTPLVTATPTVPATTAGLLTQRVRDAIGTAAKQANVTYQTADKSAVVNVTLVWSPSWRDHFTLAQAQAKTTCYQAQAAVWTSHIPLTKVTVIVLGQALDDYAEIISSAYAAADITAQHARSINWSMITVDQAWALYDHEFLRPTYTPDWVYPPPSS